MANYTTVSNVSEELNAFSISDTTTPNIDTVTTWIEQASRMIDLHTHQVWGSTVATEETHDYDGAGEFQTYHSPILAVDSLYKEVNGVGGTSISWEELEEGRIDGKDFYYYADEGDVVFHGSDKPKAGRQSLKISYTYGYTNTPLEIVQISTKIVAKRVINSVINGSASSEGGAVSVGTISVSDPSTFSLTRVKEMDSEIKSLYSDIGKFKIFRLDRVY